MDPSFTAEDAVAEVGLKQVQPSTPVERVESDLTDSSEESDEDDALQELGPPDPSLATTPRKQLQKRRVPGLSMLNGLTDRVSLLEKMRKRTNMVQKARQRRLDKFRERILKNTIHEKLFSTAPDSFKSARKDPAIVQLHYNKVQQSERSLLEAANKLMALTCTWSNPTGRQRTQTGSHRTIESTQEGKEGEIEDEFLDLDQAELEADFAMSKLFDSMGDGSTFTSHFSIEERERLIEESRQTLNKLVTRFLEISRQTAFRGFGNWIKKRSKFLEVENEQLAENLAHTSELEEDFERAKDSVEEQLLDAEFREYNALNKFYQEIQLRHERTLLARSQREEKARNEALAQKQGEPTAALKSKTISSSGKGYSLQEVEIEKHELQVQNSILQSQLEEKQAMLDLRIQHLELVAQGEQTNKDKAEFVVQQAQSAYERKAEKLLGLMNDRQQELTDLKSTIRSNSKEIDSCIATIRATGDEALIKACLREKRKLDALLQGRELSSVKEESAKQQRSRQVKQQHEGKSEGTKVSPEHPSSRSHGREKRRKERQAIRVKRKRQIKKLTQELEATLAEIENLNTRNTKLKRTVEEKEKLVRQQVRKSRREIQKQNELRKLETSLNMLLAGQETKDNSSQLDQVSSEHAKVYKMIEKLEMEIQYLEARLNKLRNKVDESKTKLSEMRNAEADRSGKFDAILQEEEDMLGEKGEIEHHSNLMSEYMSLNQAFEEETIMLAQMKDEVKLHEQTLLAAEEELALFEQEVALLAVAAIVPSRRLSTLQERSAGEESSYPTGSSESTLQEGMPIDVRVLLNSVVAVLDSYEKLDTKSTAESFRAPDTELEPLEVQAQFRYRILKITGKTKEIVNAQVQLKSERCKTLEKEIDSLQASMRTCSERERQVDKQIESSSKALATERDQVTALEEEALNKTKACFQAWEQIDFKNESAKANTVNAFESSLEQASTAQRTAKQRRAVLRKELLDMFLCKVSKAKLRCESDQLLSNYNALAAEKVVIKSELAVLDYILELFSVLSELAPSEQLQAALKDCRSLQTNIFRWLHELRTHASRASSSHVQRQFNECIEAYQKTERSLNDWHAELDQACGQHGMAWEQVVLTEQKIISILKKQKREVGSAALESQAAIRLTFLESCEDISRLWRAKSSTQPAHSEDFLCTALLDQPDAMFQDAQFALKQQQRVVKEGSQVIALDLKSSLDSFRTTLSQALVSDRVKEREPLQPFIVDGQALGLSQGTLQRETFKLQADNLRAAAQQAQGQVEQMLQAIDRGPEHELGEAKARLEAATRSKEKAEKEVVALRERLKSLTQRIAYAVDAAEEASKLDAMKSEHAAMEELLSSTQDEQLHLTKLIQSTSEQVDKLARIVEYQSKAEEEGGQGSTLTDEQERAQRQLPLFLLRRDLAFLKIGEAYVTAVLEDARQVLGALDSHRVNETFVSLLLSEEYSHLVSVSKEQLSQTIEGVKTVLEEAHTELHRESLTCLDQAEATTLRRKLDEVYETLSFVTEVSLALARIADLAVGLPNRTIPAVDLIQQPAAKDPVQPQDNKQNQDETGHEDLQQGQQLQEQSHKQLQEHSHKQRQEQSHKQLQDQPKGQPSEQQGTETGSGVQQEFPSEEETVVLVSADDNSDKPSEASNGLEAQREKSDDVSANSLSTEIETTLKKETRRKRASAIFGAIIAGAIGHTSATPSSQENETDTLETSTLGTDIFSSTSAIFKVVSAVLRSTCFDDTSDATTVLSSSGSEQSQEDKQDQGVGGGLFGLKADKLTRYLDVTRAEEKAQLAANDLSLDAPSVTSVSVGEKLRKRVRSLKTKHASASKKMTEKETLISELSEKRKHAKKVLASFSEEDKQYLQVVVELKEKIYSLAMYVANLELENESLQEELFRLSKQVEAFSVSADSILPDNQPLFRAMRKKEELVQRHEAEKEKLEHELKSLESLDTIQAEPTSKIGRLKSIRVQHEKVSIAVRDLKEQIEDRQIKMAQEDRGPRLMEKASQLRKETLSLKEEFKHLNQITLDSASLSHKAKITQIQEERDRLEAQITELEKKTGRKKKNNVATSGSKAADGTTIAANQTVADIDKDEEELELEQRLKQYQKQLVWWQHRWATRMQEAQDSIVLMT